MALSFHGILSRRIRVTREANFLLLSALFRPIASMFYCHRYLLFITIIHFEEQSAEFYNAVLQM